MSFVFGGNTGLTYEQLQQRRKALEARKGTRYRAKTVGGGLADLGHALGTRLESGRLAKAETARRGRADEAFSAFQTILGGGYNPPNQQGPEPSAFNIPRATAQPQQRAGNPQRVNPFGGVDPRLIQMMGDPSLAPQQRSTMQFLLQQHLKANAPMDPLKALQIERQQLELERLRNPQTDPMDAIKLQQEQLRLEQMQNPERNIIEGADGFKYYQDTGERVLPNVQQTPEPGYQMLTPDQVQQIGLPQGSYQQGPKGRISQIGGGGTTVNLNAAGEPNDAKLRQKLFEDTGKLWSGYRQQGAVAASNLRDLDILEELSGQAASGPMYGRLSQMFPGFDSAGAAFQSIVKRVAPTMRAEGSGSTSDVEYAGMLEAWPSLQNEPDANRAIIGIMRAKAEVDMARSDIVTRYSTGEISAADAQRQMAELNNRSILTPEMRQLLDFSNQSTPDDAGGDWVSKDGNVRIRVKPN